MVSILKKVDRSVFVFFLFLLIGGLTPAYLPAAEKSFQNSKGMTFALIPAGAFIMGSPASEAHRNSNETQHKVIISKPFYMQTTEVTRQQWQALMGKKWFSRLKGGKDMPMVKVSWFDGIRFIEKLNELNEGTYRLPTEAEWEYAARAGSIDAYPWGKQIDCSKAVFSNNSLKSKDCVEYHKSKGIKPDGPAPVKSHPPNAWGLYDMHGNVWEWCQDWYEAYPKAEAIDPGGPETGLKRVRRGGSWFSGGNFCRSSNRNTGHPGTKHKTLGFRVVREVTNEGIIK